MIARNALLTEGPLSLSSAAIANPEALDILHQHYGLDGKVMRLATEKDDTFRLTCADGQSYILKIANGAEDPQDIALQIDLLRYLERTSPELPVSRVVPNRERQFQFSHTDSSGQRREVSLLAFLPGVPLSEVSATAPQREKVGESLALLRLAMANYAHEADARILAWDIRHLSTLAPLLDEITGADRRRLLESGLQRFETIAPRLAQCRTQVVHNDFSKSNIVVNPSEQSFVTGIIDFGDAVRTAIAIDVSTALLNQLPSRETADFFGDGHDVLRGYLAVADLTDEELRLIPHLVMGRVVARALLTLWRARLFPENAPYIIRNTDQGWYQLDWFLSRPMDRISNEFLAAAGR